MKSRITLRIILITLSFFNMGPFCSAMDPAPAHTSVKITYIANEGFLIEAKGKKILIDALFGDQEMGFCDIPTYEVIRDMKDASGVFKDVDILCATHQHRDHFYAPFVATHLKSNPAGTFISCQQTIDLLMEEEKIPASEDQVMPITPSKLMHIDTLINGIGVRIYRMKHGPYYVDEPGTGNKIDRHRNVENLGFLFDINGIKVFHCGDSGPTCLEDYQQFRLDQEGIDVALMGRGFLWSKEGPGIKILRDLVKADHYVLMHIHHDQNQHFQDVANEVKSEFPSVTIFKSRMESISFPIL